MGAAYGTDELGLCSHGLAYQAGGAPTSGFAKDMAIFGESHNVSASYGRILCCGRATGAYFAVQFVVGHL